MIEWSCWGQCYRSKNIQDWNCWVGEVKFFSIPKFCQFMVDWTVLWRFCYETSQMEQNWGADTLYKLGPSRDHIWLICSLIGQDNNLVKGVQTSVLVFHQSNLYNIVPSLRKSLKFRGLKIFTWPIVEKYSTWHLNNSGTTSTLAGIRCTINLTNILTTTIIHNCSSRFTQEGAVCCCH